MKSVVDDLDDEDFLDLLGPEHGLNDPGRPVATTEPVAAEELPIMSLGELASLSDTSLAPVQIIPRIAIHGRVTLLAAEEKAGKSTLVGQAVAAMAQGELFLKAPTVKGTTLWLAYDEPVDDAVRRLLGYGAREESVWLAEDSLSLRQMEEALARYRPSLMVIDTLREFASRTGVDDLNAAREWTPLLRKVRRMCSEHGTAAILLHHTIKGTGRYADSAAIGAGVDLILEMSRARQDQHLRFINFRGRGVGHGTFRIRFRDNLYHLDQGWE